MSELPSGLTFRLMHVGVAVADIQDGTSALESIFGYRVVSGPFDDPIQKVTVNFMTQSAEDAVEVELISPLTDDSPLRSVLSKNGGGAYHLCFQTNDIEAALAHVRKNGCVVVSNPVPAVAFGGRRIAWFYTRTRQLFELVEQKSPITELANSTHLGRP